MELGPQMDIIKEELSKMILEELVNQNLAHKTSKNEKLEEAETKIRNMSAKLIEYEKKVAKMIITMKDPEKKLYIQSMQDQWDDKQVLEVKLIKQEDEMFVLKKNVQRWEFEYEKERRLSEKLEKLLHNESFTVE